jgi:rRNA-processing protein FCF1
MKVFINDANILIDLVKLHIEEAFLSLHVDLYTTDFVFSELTGIQQQSVTSDRLTVISTETPEDFGGIATLYNAHNGVSFEDCSVWYYTQKMNATLITGDRTLRKKVTQSGLDVKGILFILEEIKNQKLLPLNECILKLEELKLLNNRLPFAEIDQRIQAWKNEH